MDRPKVIFTKEFKEAIIEAKDLSEIGEILMTDLKRVIEISDEKIKQFKDAPESRFLNEQETWIRLSNRLLITTIDAVCFKMKQFALIGHRMRKKQLGEEDIMKLTEKQKSGRPFIIGTGKNLDYAFRMTAATFDSKYELKHDKEWEVFQKLIKKRRGLTHPKSKADLSVSFSDHQDALNTAMWFTKVLHELMDSIPKL